MQWWLVITIVLRSSSLSFVSSFIWWTTSITKLLQLALFSASRMLTRSSNRLNLLSFGSGRRRRSLWLRIRVILRVIRVNDLATGCSSLTSFVKVSCVRNILLSFPVSKFGYIRTLLQQTIQSLHQQCLPQNIQQKHKDPREQSSQNQDRHNNSNNTMIFEN